MNELEPLNIVDDRTPEQVRVDGNTRWPDGSPYILRGVCCACGATDVDEMHMCLIKLEQDAPCSAPHCGRTAHWAVNLLPLCDEDIIVVSGMNSDNEQFFAPALAEIQWRKEARRLFFSVMRKPEMRVLRKALMHLKLEREIDWRALPDLTIDQYTESSWMLSSYGFILVCLNTESPRLTYEDFWFSWTHVGRPDCPCEDCDWIRAYNIPRFFAFLARNLEVLYKEAGFDLSTITEITFEPDSSREWWATTETQYAQLWNDYQDCLTCVQSGRRSDIWDL